MMSKKAKKKAKKEIIESAMQSVKAKVAAASNGEVKLKDGKDDEIYRGRGAWLVIDDADRRTK